VVVANAAAVTVVTAALWSKRLELLHYLLTSVTLLARLLDPNHPTAEAITKDVQTAAQKLGLQVYIAKARSHRDTDDAFAVLVRERVGALLVTADPLFIGMRSQVVALANRSAGHLFGLWHKADVTAALMNVPC
jgi:putative tryptophan/tyrosine transport system substrate-binding protein